MPPFFALRLGHEEVAMTLIEAQANLNYTYENGSFNDPLWKLIIETKSQRVLEHCLTHQYLDPNVSCYGLNLLGCAILFQWKESLECIIKAGGELKSVITNFDNYVEYLAICCNKAGGHFDPTTFKKQSSAWTMALRIDEDLFLQLLSLTEEQAKEGQNTYTADLLFVGVNLNRNKAIQILLKMGFDARILDNEGCTPYLTAKVAKYLDAPSLAEETMQELKEADQKFSKIITQIKVFGGRFSLQGTLFEGFFRHKNFYKQIHKTLTLFFSSQPLQGQETILEAVHSASHITTEEAMKRHEENKIIVLPTGWSGHATGVVISGNRVYKVNTGEYSDSPGIQCYKIRKDKPKTSENIPKEAKDMLRKKREVVIDTLLRNDKCVKSEKVKAVQFFNEDMDVQLNLKKIAVLKRKQTTNNCHRMSATHVVEALFMDQRLSTKTSYKLSDVVEAYNDISESFESWVDRDLHEGILEFKAILPNINKLVDVSEALEDTWDFCKDREDLRNCNGVRLTAELSTIETGC